MENQHFRLFQVVLLALTLTLLDAFSIYTTHSNNNFQDNNKARGCNVAASPETTETVIAIPIILKQLKTGGTLLGYRRIRNDTAPKGFYYSHNVTLERVASRPPIYVLRQFVTRDESEILCREMEQQQMSPGRTASRYQEQVTRKDSMVGWLTPKQIDGLVGRLAEAAWNLLMPKRTEGRQGVEDLQVVRYHPGGEYVLHHDGNQRVLTVLYYLNGVGETWFPLALREDEEAASQQRRPPPGSRLQALEQAKNCTLGTDGVLLTCHAEQYASKHSQEGGAVVTIRQGDAIAFYNYHEDGSLDWMALHAGLSASKTKWIANHWFHYAPFGAADNFSSNRTSGGRYGTFFETKMN